ncbi:MAG TPA: ankyrin repeat domain-containing protein [Patescibacteria group bacterium]|nr:ankyrin repeat domain-containing protein [Patescibacteria group bacterium]
MDFTKIKNAAKAVRKFLTSQEALNTRLLQAVEQNNIAKATKALADGANASAGSGGWRNDSPLLAAIIAANVEMVKLLTAAGADVNKKISYGDDTPFTEAARRGNLPVITALLDAGAKINAKGDRGQTAYLQAVATKNKPLADLLEQRGANLDTADKYGWSPITYAIKNGDIETVQALLAKDVRTNRIDEEDRSLTDIATQLQQWSALRALQDHADKKVPQWQLLPDADAVAHVSIMRDLGYKLTEVFNTRTQRLTAITHNFETGLDSTLVRPLADADKPAVDEAVKQLASLKAPKPEAKPQVQP